MKKLLLSVSCVNEYASETPESFYVEIDKSLKDIIKKIAQAVSDLDVYAVEDFNYSGEWSDLFIEPSEIEEANGNLDNVLALLKAAEARVDVPMLRVTKDVFYFIAVPKHCGDDQAISTARVKIEHLDNDDTYIDLD
jgi:hypothetical protein